MLLATFRVSGTSSLLISLSLISSILVTFLTIFIKNLHKLALGGFLGGQNTRESISLLNSEKFKIILPCKSYIRTVFEIIIIDHSLSNISTLAGFKKKTSEGSLAIFLFFYFRDPLYLRQLYFKIESILLLIGRTDHFKHIFTSFLNQIHCMITAF